MNNFGAWRASQKRQLASVCPIPGMLLLYKRKTRRLPWLATVPGNGRWCYMDDKKRKSNLTVKFQGVRDLPQVKSI